MQDDGDDTSDSQRNECFDRVQNYHIAEPRANKCKTQVRSSKANEVRVNVVQPETSQEGTKKLYFLNKPLEQSEPKRRRVDKSRRRLWATLLEERPATDDEDLMLEWINKVLLVSDFEQPVDLRLLRGAQKSGAASMKPKS